MKYKIYGLMVILNILVVNNSYAQNNNDLKPIIIQSPNFNNNVPVVSSDFSVKDEFLGPNKQSDNTNTTVTSSDNTQQFTSDIKNTNKNVIPQTNVNQTINLSDDNLVGQTFYANNLYLHQEDVGASKIIGHFKNHEKFTITAKDDKYGWYQITFENLADGFAYLPWENFTNDNINYLPYNFKKSTQNTKPDYQQTVNTNSNVSNKHTDISNVKSASLPSIINPDVLKLSPKSNYQSIPTDVSPLLTMQSLVK